MNKLYMKEGHIYAFEDRISKEKLPRGLSYVLQTTDITSVLSTDGLCLNYSYQADNPRKPEKQQNGDISFTNVELLSYTKHVKRWGEPGTLFDYDRHMSIYSVPAKIRYRFRNTLTYKILPRLKDLESKPKFHVAIYYRCFSKSNYEPLDRGGLYRAGQIWR